MDPQQRALSSPDCAILTYWRLPRLNGKTLSCTSYRTRVGLELRAGLDGDTPLFQAVIPTHAEALQLAEAWRLKITQSAAA